MDDSILLIFFYQVDGAGDLITSLKDKYDLVLATNPVFPLDAIKTRLEGGGINFNNFSYISSSQHMHHCKPSVDYYIELINKLKLNPAECLMIGNDPKKDLPAAEVGIKTFLLETKKSKKDILKYSNDPRIYKTGTIKDLENLLR